MTLTDQDLTRRISEQSWTAHNIRFTPGVAAIPNMPDFENDIRLKAILGLLSSFHRYRGWKLRLT